MISPLDDREQVARLDPGGMLGALRGLSEQCRTAWEAAQDMDLDMRGEEVGRIVVLGMGGSAIAGDLWRVLLQRECRVPVFNVRGYDLPPYVDEGTLVVASSFSGDTEEVLSAFEEALATPARKVAVTTGGRLLTTARANGIPVFTFEFAHEPRSAIGWGLMPLLAIGERLGLTQGIGRDVEEMVDIVGWVTGEIAEEVPTDNNAAKQMAEDLVGKLPVVYGAGPLYEVAHRWKTQLNESGKTWAFHEELPEIHHNAIIGYGLPQAVARSTAVVVLESADLVHPRVRLRYEFTRGLLAKAGVATVSAQSWGRSALAQMMSLVIFGDYVSTYLGMLYGEDPTQTRVIDELKDWLAKQP